MFAEFISFLVVFSLKQNYFLLIMILKVFSSVAHRHFTHARTRTHAQSGMFDRLAKFSFCV